MCPDAEFASSNLLWQAQRLEVQIRATGVGAGLPSGRPRNRPGAKPRENQAAEVRLCPALRWQSRSPPAPSAHAVADIVRRECEVFDLVRDSLILYPQRDSNPCCRLERAKS